MLRAPGGRDGVRFALALLLPAVHGISSCDRNDLEEGPGLPTSQAPDDDDQVPAECMPGSAADLRGKIFINEVMPLNTSTIEDERGGFPPWIEIYNASGAEIQLGGMGFSDEIGSPEKWVFPCSERSIIPAGGFLVVFADGETADPGDLHASFTLEAAPLELILNKGSNLFFFDASALTPDRSVGRLPDGASSIVALDAPSPGAPNAGAPLIPAEGRFVRGDANGDGRIDAIDMHHVLRVLRAWEPLPRCQDRLDADDSGSVNPMDAYRIGAAIFEAGPALPPPGPDPGADPTSDGVPCPPG